MLVQAHEDNAIIVHATGLSILIKMISASNLSKPRLPVIKALPPNCITHQNAIFIAPY
jgi:hypothetical protein